MVSLNSGRPSSFFNFFSTLRMVHSICNLCNHMDCPGIDLTPEQTIEWQIDEKLIQRRKEKIGWITSLEELYKEEGWTELAEERKQEIIERITKQNIETQQQRDEVEMDPRELQFLRNICICCFAKLNNLHPIYHRSPRYGYPFQLEESKETYIRIEGSPLKADTPFWSISTNPNVILVFDDPAIEKQKKLIKELICYYCYRQKDDLISFKGDRKICSDCKELYK